MKNSSFESRPSFELQRCSLTVERLACLLACLLVVVAVYSSFVSERIYRLRLAADALQAGRIGAAGASRFTRRS